MAKKEYDVFDMMTGKFGEEHGLEDFILDFQTARAEYEIVKAILEHHLQPVKGESGD
tara:strand:- start:323 stop:493 length:171 start_codon:yes stop_codon:yes gene_type:complete